MGCNWRTFEELPPLTKIAIESGLHWAAIERLLRVYPPPPRLKLHRKSGLQWAAMGGLLRVYSPPN